MNKKFAVVKKLTTLFNITNSQAELIRKLVKDEMTIEDNDYWEDTIPKTISWTRLCEHNPLNSNYHSYSEVVLTAICELIGGFGIEPINQCYEKLWVSSYWQNCRFTYCNMGDTYTSTILYDTAKDRFFVSSYGDVVESNNL